MRSIFLPLFILELASAGAAAAAWTPDGSAVCTELGAQSYPVVARSGDGAVVAWQDQRAGAMNTDIYVSRIRQSGAITAGWPANGVALCTAAGVQESPAIVSDGAGGAIVVWQDQRTGTYDVYAQRVTAAGVLSPGWPADGVALCSGAGDQTAPVVCTDGAGGAFVAWSDTRLGPSNSNVYAQRVTAAGVIAPGWSANGQRVCTAPDLQVFSDIASDGAGGAIVCWVDRRSGLTFDLFAERLTANGTVAIGWPDSGAVVSKGAGDQTSPDMVEDGSGGVFVVWNDYGAPDGDVFAQHLGADGLPVAGWNANGNVVCDAAGAQFAPQLAADGVGGAVFVWEDYRGAGDIFGMRLTGGGANALGWAADGIPICDATAFQLAPVVVGDGSGGAIFAWEDQRNVGVNNDVYALRVLGDATVAPGWTADGNGICTAGDRQYVPSIAGDGSGGAYITWQDRRTVVHYDIYAARVGPDLSPTVSVDGGELQAAMALSAGPNPFRATARFALTLPRAGELRLDVCDAAGRRVRGLHQGPLASGAHVFLWDGRDGTGGLAPPGVYLVRASGVAGAIERQIVRVR